MTLSWLPALRFDRNFAFAGALLVLTLGLIAGILNESAFSQQKLRDLDTQARILAQSVAAPLMFTDPAAAQENAVALAENPEVDAVGVYDDNGSLVASFQRPGAEHPPQSPESQAATYRGAFLETVRPVQRDGQSYGHIFLRFRSEPFLVRLQRYAPLGLLILMTALVLVVAGAAQGALKRAYTQLQQKAGDLSNANAALASEIEQRKIAEEALFQSRKLEAIGQLTGGVAHDFNNLLMVVSGGLRMLLRFEDPERRRGIMEAMQQAVERGAGLTRQLLAFGRHQPMKLETIALDARVSAMRPLLERSLRADILLDITIPVGLPPVVTDPGQLELAMLNLCVNARDAMPKGGVITISARRRQDEMVELLIQDTGSGIPPEILSRIFEPYFTTKPVGRGTGLGLSQVYGFARQIGGDIRVESKVGVGATFILSQPVSREKLIPLTDKAVEPASVSQGRKILVVEDEPSVAVAVCSMLDELGYESQRVSSAIDALELIRSGARFDLVFSDVIMPGGKSGIELARDLEGETPNMPVLLTTGYSGKEEIETGRRILRKPYQIGDLRAAIASVLRQEGALQDSGEPASTRG